MKDWTFKDGFANKFDSHVREQLPFYEMVTESVSFIVRNYLPKNGTIYDIGCSTGNITKALEKLIQERNAEVVAIDDSHEMIEIYKKNTNDLYQTSCTNALNYHYKNFDVAILMLTAMFFPVMEQELFFNNLYEKLNKGGIIVVVDKVNDSQDYFATVMKRLTMYWKLKNGANAKDIIEKEISLSGIQRPIKEEFLPKAKQFFQLGEFKGWVIEK